MLASFAMQESSCNPSAVGGAGEQGLMQITKDKCKGAPNGNCKDIVSFLMHEFYELIYCHRPGLQYQGRRRVFCCYLGFQWR